MPDQRRRVCERAWPRAGNAQVAIVAAARRRERGCRGDAERIAARTIEAEWRRLVAVRRATQTADARVRQGLGVVADALSALGLVDDPRLET